MFHLPCICRRIGALLAFMSLLVSGMEAAAATTYFIRESGNDAARGDSTNTAWRTIERVNRADLQPGDRVLFEGGQSFSGSLRLTAEDSGTSNAPVVIGSFGTGRAILLPGHATGVSVESAGGLAIENLILRGAGRTNNTNCGILCDNKLKSGKRLAHLRIQNVEVSGFGMFGILVTGEQSGFAHIRILDCVLHDNLRGGLEVTGRLPSPSGNYVHADVQVSRCQAFNNTGDPQYLKNHSGSGLVLQQVDGGVMEQCAAWNNGAECRSKVGGGVGLWTSASRRVVIQECESFANRTSGLDGGGFDIDGGCVECVLQYNYSHDNDGPGLMVYNYAQATQAARGSVVRFNISENDSRKSRTYAGLWLRSDGPKISGVEIYNNTVLIGPWADQAVLVHGREVEASIRNNIFVSTGSSIPLRVIEPHGGLRLEGNLYWREGARVEIAWGSKAYSSLAEWRDRTGQESFRGQPTGLWASPQLSGHAPGVRARNPISLSSLRAFRPLANSPARAGGLDLPQVFGQNTGARDFLGHRLPFSGSWPVGARYEPARSSGPP